MKYLGFFCIIKQLADNMALYKIHITIGSYRNKSLVLIQAETKSSAFIERLFVSSIKTKDE